MKDTVSFELTQREITLIRAQLLAHQQSLRRSTEGYNPLNAFDAGCLAELDAARSETDALLRKLHY